MAKTNIAHWCLLALAVSALNVHAADTSSPFPRPSELERDVRFWTRVYTEVDTNGGFIHDERDLSVIYETVQFPPQLSEHGRRQQVGKKKQHYRAPKPRIAG